MGRKEEIREIDKEKYTFYRLPPRESLKVLTKITKILGGAAGKAVSSATSSKNLLDKIDAGSIIGGIADRLDEDEVMQIVDTMLSTVVHTGEGEVSKAFDTLFQGRITHLLKVLKVALEVEYQDFFGVESGLKNIITKAKAAMNPES